MKIRISLFIICMLLTQSVSAGDKFSLIWTDIFPACATESEGYSSIRCGCEFIVPNFHISMISNMLFKMIVSIFKPIIDMTELIWNLTPLSNLTNFSGDISLDGIKKFIQDNLFSGVIDPKKVDKVIPEDTQLKLENDPINTSIGLVMDYLMDWIFGVITPFLVIIGILTIEFIKTYLAMTVPFALILRLLSEIKLVDGSNPQWGIVIAVFSVIFMFIGSIWLLGSDMELYKPLVIW